MGKTAIVTFYNDSANMLNIGNGFSYVYHLLDDVTPLFISDHDHMIDGSIFESFDTIYASVSFFRQLRVLQSHVDDRWLIGGPFVTFNRELCSLFVKDSLLFSGLMETYLGVAKSNVFTYYWNDWLYKNYDVSSLNSISYSLSFGSGCYWNKCVFCDSVVRTIDRFDRPGLENILESVYKYPMMSAFHTGIGSITPNQLRLVLKYLPVLYDKNVNILTFIRSDPSILNVLMKVESLEGLDFFLGMETFSQIISDRLNKNVNKKVELNIIEKIVKSGGYLSINIMHPFNVFTSETFLESVMYLKELSKVITDPERVKFCCVGPVQWNSPEAARNFNDGEVLEKFFYDRYIDVPVRKYYINTTNSNKINEYNRVIQNMLEQIGPLRLGTA